MAGQEVARRLHDGRARRRRDAAGQPGFTAARAGHRLRGPGSQVAGRWPARFTGRHAGLEGHSAESACASRVTPAPNLILRVRNVSILIDVFAGMICRT